MQPAQPRLAEVVAAISLATDLGMGQPLQHALRTCVIATRLAESADLPARERPVVYYTALLRYLGCTADAHLMSATFADEIAARAAFARLDPASTRRQLGWLVRHSRGPGALARAIAEGDRGTREVYATACDVARRLAERLGLPEEVQRALLQAFERWDGSGFPAGLRGDEICPAARVVAIARDAELGVPLRGHDPRLVAALGHDDTGSAWETALAIEPPPRRHVVDLDAVCRAIADFADLKTPFTLGHSTGVAELAEAAAWRLGLDAEHVRRAALLHDLGRVGVPTSIWERPGRLSPDELERVRLHPYLTERVLSHAPALAPLARTAALHHERLDGSGYHRGCTAAELPAEARVIAAADVFHALTEPRPHRPPVRDPAGTLVREVGRLDADAVEAVLLVAGERAPVGRPRPAGLTDRELEVLRLVARGHTNRSIGKALGIATKTAGHHVEHIYAKTGCSTRAGAALFAAEHDLL